MPARLADLQVFRTLVGKAQPVRAFLRVVGAGDADLGPLRRIGGPVGELQDRRAHFGDAVQARPVAGPAEELLQPVELRTKSQLPSKLKQPFAKAERLLTIRRADMMRCRVKAQGPPEWVKQRSARGKRNRGRRAIFRVGLDAASGIAQELADRPHVPLVPRRAQRQDGTLLADCDLVLQGLAVLEPRIEEPQRVPGGQ